MTPTEEIDHETDTDELVEAILKAVDTAEALMAEIRAKADELRRK